MEVLYIIVTIIGILIWAAILQAIISSATRTDDRMTMEKKQLNLLAAIAIKLGVSNEEVKEIITPKSKSKPKGRF